MVCKTKSILKNVLIFFFIIYTNLSFAADFLASVSNTNVVMGQSFALKLTLHEAKMQQEPNFSALAKDFSIYSKQQYSSYSNNNGNVTSEQGWDIILLPNAEGNFEIPSVEINTNKGKLVTKPIAITVSKSSTASQSNDPNDNIGISLIANTNKTQAYIKEPIIYTLKVISYKPIANMTLENIKATDAIIDKIGQPKQYSQSLGGVRANIVEIKYHITPLVAGKIEILPAIIHGEVQIPAQNQSNPQGRFGIFNPFMFNQVELKPFSVQGDKLVINGISPPIKSKDWLPAQSLTLSEEWTGIDTPKVGDTITRRIRISATGLLSNQLPNIKEQLDIANVKIYADKPALNDVANADTDVVTGTKEELYTLVPLREGKLTFPAINISWWNLRTKQLEVSTLPARSVNLMPAASGASKNTVLDYSDKQPEVLPSSKQFGSNILNWMTVLIVSLILTISIMFACIIYFLKRKHIVTTNPGKNFNKPAQSAITTVAELRDQILFYAAKHWQLPTNITLNQIGAGLSNNHYIYDVALYVELCRQINAALYANNQANLSALMSDWQRLKQSVQKNKLKAVKQAESDYADLNPT